MRTVLTLALLWMPLASIPFPALGQPAQGATSEQIFDVRNGDQTGKLILGETELAFESLTDARHSRRWKYADIRELSKKKSEFTVRPFKGDRYDFQFKDKKLRDRIYNMISDKIIAARRPR